MHQHLFTDPRAVAILDTCPTRHWRGNRIYRMYLCNTDGDHAYVWACYPCASEAMRIEERAQP
jgi:hypothetical protein